MNNDKKEFGKRLAEIRKTKKMNQEELRELIDAPTVQMISGWETGHAFPSTPYLIILAKRLDISLDYLLLGRQNGPNDKSIKTYKDAAIYITPLIKSGLFNGDKYRYGEKDYQIGVMLESKEAHIRDFMIELDNLFIASKTIRPDLMEQAMEDLFNKYDIPLKEN